MLKQILGVLISFICLTQSLSAQIEEYAGIRIYGLRTSFNNNDLPGNNGESRFSIGLDAVIGRYGKGELQYAYRAPFIDDIVPEVAKLLKGTSAETPGETFLTGIIPGWFQIGYNVYSSDNLCISPGVFLGDFWYNAVASSSLNPNINVPAGTIEPSGWYGGVGPAVFIDFKVTGVESLILHYESFFAFSKRWSESKGVEEEGNFNPNSEDPFFFQSRFEIRYKDLFLGYRWVKMINRYDLTSEYNGGSRSDILFGFIF